MSVEIRQIVNTRIKSIEAWFSDRFTLLWSVQGACITDKEKPVLKSFAFQKLFNFIVCYIFGTKNKGPHKNYADRQGGRVFFQMSMLLHKLRRGVKNLQNLVYVVCVWPLSKLSTSATLRTCTRMQNCRYFLF